jgi:signal transduction histidine kinase
MSNSKGAEPSGAGFYPEALRGDLFSDLADLTPNQLQERFQSLAVSAHRLERENQELRATLNETIYWLWCIRKEDEIALAKALHGGPIQELSSLLFEINLLLQRIQDKQINETVESLKKDLKSAIQHLRQFVNDLNSPALIHFGLQAAIRSTVEKFQSEHEDLHVALFIGIDQRLPNPDTEWILHRILQQLLQNAAEHAQARNLMIRLRRNGDRIELDVEDDGIGFELPSWSTLLEQGQHGLFMAKIQTEIINGLFVINTQPGQGTKIQVKVPFPNQETGN